MERITRFGFELEICWYYGKQGCTRTDKPSYKDFQNMDFLEKFKYYLFNVLLHEENPALQLITQLDAKYGGSEIGILYYDDSEELNRVIVDLINPGSIDAPNFINIGSKYDARFAHYKIPIFTEDVSVDCRIVDTSQQNSANNKNESSEFASTRTESMAIECITPILEIEGEVTEEKVELWTNLYLALFGLYSPQCFYTNYTTGFHVNVSLADSDGQTIRLNCESFRKFFIPEYIRYESQMYSKVRQQLKKGQTYSSWATPLSKVQANTLALEDEANRVNQEHSLFLLQTKHWAVLLKTNSVFEFRLYGSDTDFRRLGSYVYQACHLLNHIYDRYMAKKAKGILGGRRQTRRLLRRVRRTRRLR